MSEVFFPAQCALMAQGASRVNAQGYSSAIPPAQNTLGRLHRISRAPQPGRAFGAWVRACTGDLQHRGRQTHGSILLTFIARVVQGHRRGRVRRLARIILASGTIRPSPAGWNCAPQPPCSLPIERNPNPNPCSLPIERNTLRIPTPHTFSLCAPPYFLPCPPPAPPPCLPAPSIAERHPFLLQPGQIRCAGLAECPHCARLRATGSGRGRRGKG